MAKTGENNHAVGKAIRNTEPSLENVNDTARDFLQGVAHSAIVGFTAEELTGYGIESNVKYTEQFIQNALEAARRKRTQQKNKIVKNCW